VQERVTQCTALAIRDTLVRFERLPLVVRLADMPPQLAGAPIRVAIGDVDLFDCSVECRFAGLAEPAESSPPPT